MFSGLSSSFGASGCWLTGPSSVFSSFTGSCLHSEVCTCDASVFSGSVFSGSVFYGSVFSASVFSGSFSSFSSL